MIELGSIHLEDMFNSNVFSYEFDLDQWPTSHYNNAEEKRDYNDNIFLIGRHYETVFPEVEFIPIDVLSPEDQERLGLLHKVQYSVNLLPMLGAHYE